MKKKKQPSSIDPAVIAAMAGSQYGEEREESKPSSESDAETERVRLRIDVPEWLRKAVIEGSEEEDTNISQFAAFLMAYGLQLYRDEDQDLHELLAASKTSIRSLRWGYGIDLTSLADRLSE